MTVSPCLRGAPGFLSPVYTRAFYYDSFATFGNIDSKSLFTVNSPAWVLLSQVWNKSFCKWPVISLDTCLGISCEQPEFPP